MALVKYNNNSISDVTELAGVPTGALTHIKTLTASSSATLSFVDGSSDVVLDSTYPIYLFKFINIHPATDDTDFQFNMSIDSGSNYNVTKTSSFFAAYNFENDSGAALNYQSARDLAQSTAFQILDYGVGNGNDESCSGFLRIFNPSSTTFVKHFISQFSSYNYQSENDNQLCAGYGNTTSAVDAIQFKMDSGNIDAGDICLYGIN
jgi:hypothetical protein